MDPILSAVLGTFTGFLGTYLSREHYWHKRLADTERELKEQLHASKTELELFRKSVTYYEDVDHLLVLDGPSKSGKSALVAKWTNPAVDVQKLRKTQGLAEVHHFLCAEQYFANGFRCERRHRLKYLDLPGEHAGDVVAAFDEVKPKFVVIVVDPENLDLSLDRHSANRLTYLYGRKDVREALVGVLIYVSKSDRLVDSEQRSYVEGVVTQRIIPEFSRYGVHPYAFTGSALTGAELINAMGFIVDRLGLRSQFPKHASLA